IHPSLRALDPRLPRLFDVVPWPLIDSLATDRNLSGVIRDLEPIAASTVGVTFMSSAGLLKRCAGSFCNITSSKALIDGGKPLSFTLGKVACWCRYISSGTDPLN